MRCGKKVPKKVPADSRQGAPKKVLPRRCQPIGPQKVPTDWLAAGGYWRLDAWRKFEAALSVFGSMARRLRFIPPGSLVEVTCRTIQGRLLLRPSPVLHDAIRGVLARAARLYAVEVHALPFFRITTTCSSAFGMPGSWPPS